MDNVCNRTREKRDNLTAYAFLSPWIVGFILFSGVPIVACFLLGFTKWDMISVPKLIGINNYLEMFTAGSSFWRVIWVTLLFTVVSVVVTLTWALFLAVLLNTKLKGIGVFQCLFFAPAVMPPIALAFVFQLMYNKEIGIINYFLYEIGIKNGPNWLMDEKLVIPSIIFVSLFTYSTGQMMIIFNASLKEVPRELYEACEIDGANFFQQFFHVTISFISPIILFNLIIATISSLNASFNIIWPLTEGGPAGACEVLSIAIYQSGFKQFRMGYASSLATILFLIVASISWLQFRLSKKLVYYES